MEEFSRSKSSREKPGVLQPISMHGLRSSSTSDYNPTQNRDFKSDDFKKEYNNSNNNNNNNKSKNRASSSTKNWKFDVDPELQRKKRVAGYKAYAVEGKMKNSLTKSFRWMKDNFLKFW